MKKVLIPFTLKSILSYFKVSCFNNLTIEKVSILMGSTVILKNSRSKNDYCLTIANINKNSTGITFQLSNQNQFILNEKGLGERMDVYTILIWVPEELPKM